MKIVNDKEIKDEMIKQIAALGKKIHKVLYQAEANDSLAMSTVTSVFMKCLLFVRKEMRAAVIQGVSKEFKRLLKEDMKDER
jgi:hypothetical protein